MRSSELESFLASFPACIMDADDPLETVREKMIGIHPHGHGDDTVVEPLELGGVECARVSTPSTDPGRHVFFVHGGAFVSTGLPEYMIYAQTIATFCHAQVLVPSYSLAPEVPYPGQLDELAAAYEAAGLPSDRTAFMGDSCGGGMALALMGRLRARGRPLPACYAGLTPWLDALQAGDSACAPRGVDPFVSAPWIRARFRDYAGTAALDTPELSPIGLDLRGFPPLYLGVGTIDTTSDDSTRLAARASREGVQVLLDVNAGHIHGLHGLAGMCPESTAAMARVGEFVRTYIP